MSGKRAEVICSRTVRQLELGRDRCTPVALPC